MDNEQNICLMIGAFHGIIQLSAMVTLFISSYSPRAFVRHLLSYKEYEGLTLLHLYLDTLDLGATVFIFHGIIEKEYMYILMWLVLASVNVAASMISSLIMYIIGEECVWSLEIFIWLLRGFTCFCIHKIRLFFMKIELPRDERRVTFSRYSDYGGTRPTVIAFPDY